MDYFKRSEALNKDELKPGYYIAILPKHNRRINNIKNSEGSVIVEYFEDKTIAIFGEKRSKRFSIENIQFYKKIKLPNPNYR